MAEQTSRLAIILDSTGAKRSADTLATSLERLTTQGERASTSTDDLGFSFKRLATSAAGALSIGVVIKTVDEWGQVAARIKNALKSVEGDIKNYSMLQERFLEISNRNGKNIADTQLLYIGAATSMQELGYSTEQTVDYIESLSSSMTANASSVNEVLSMQNALNKSMVTGKVAGENWNSIMNATPTLLGDIAKQLEKQNGGIKVTEMEVKKLAADGKISFKLFADAVMAAKEANNALADSMDNTVADGFTRLTNSAKAYYGELNQSLGITRSMSAGLAGLSDNFDAVSVVLTSVVGIGAARYFGNLSNSIYDSTKKAAENALVNRKLAVDKLNVARAALIQAQNEKASAIAAIGSTKAQQAAATTEVQRISLKTQLANQTAVLTAATKAETVATTELAAAQGRLSVANNLVKGGLALVGGPVGLAMLAGAGLYYYSQQAEQAREKTLGFINELPELITNLTKLTDIQLKAAAVRNRENIEAQTEEYNKQKDAVEKLKNEIGNYQGYINKFKDSPTESYRADIYLEKQTPLLGELIKKEEELERTTVKLSYAQDTLGIINKELTHRFGDQMQATRQQSDALDSAAPKVKILADAQSFLAQKLGISTNAMKQFNAQSLLLNYGGEDANKLIEGMKQQVELSEKTGKARAQLAAEQAAIRSGANPEGINEAIRLAGIEYDNIERQRELGRTTTQTESAAQKMLATLREQQASLTLQKELGKDIGSQEQAKATFLAKIKKIEADQATGKLTADQKSLLASKELIQAEFDRNIQLEQAIKNREAEVKIASFHKQMMEEAEQAQKRYNQTIEMAGMGTLAQGRMQERFQIEAEFERKQADLQKQFQDKSTGMTKAMYDEETQFISSQLQARLAMLEDFHVKQNAMRGNWTLGVHMALQNYADNARDYSQQAEGFITNSLQNITSGSTDALTDIVTNSKNAFDAIGDFFGDLSKSIIKDLIRIAIQAQITNAVSGMFGGGGIFGGSSSRANAFSTGAYGNLSLTGMAHSGIDRVPETGTWLLEKGERVMTQDTSARLDKLLTEFSNGTHPDQYAMKYLHPASQTNNTTNNSSTSNSNTESNENNSEQNVTYVINQTINITGSGDRVLDRIVTVAANKGAKQAIAEIQRDFATNGKTRKILER